MRWSAKKLIVDYICSFCCRVQKHSAVFLQILGADLQICQQYRIKSKYYTFKTEYYLFYKMAALFLYDIISIEIISAPVRCPNEERTKHRTERIPRRGMSGGHKLMSIFSVMERYMKKNTGSRNIFSSIQTKFFAISLVIALGITFVSLLISYYAEMDTIKRTTESYLTQYLYFADDSFQTMLNEAKQVSLTIAAEKQVLSSQLKIRGSTASYENYRNRKQIKRFLGNLINQRPYIEDIILVSWDRIVYQARDNLIIKQDLETPIMERALELKRTEIIYDGEKETLLCTPIQIDRERKITCIVKMNYESLVEIYQVSPLDSMNIYVVDAEKNLFYADGGLNGREKELLEEVEGSGRNAGYISFCDKRVYFVCFESEVSALKTIAVIPDDVLSADALRMRKRFLLIGVFAVFLASFATICFSRRLCSSLRKLTVCIDRISAGDLYVRADVAGTDEIGKLSVTFNSMMDQIRFLMDEIAVKERLKHEAQQSVLAAQIEPHFLYNTIDSIYYVAHMKGEKEIEEVAMALSELYRSVLGNQNIFISLWEEREYVENYLKIERFKYRENFHLRWEVDEELWTYRIPKLLLQPIVENALIHGISDMGEDGMIQIKAYEEREFVIIQILDNGKGMDEEQIQKLMAAGDQKEKFGFRRVGISNVFSRIRLIYGEQYSGTITSCVNMFTCVELRLPKDGGEDEIFRIDRR